MTNSLTKRKLQSIESRKKIFETAISLIKEKGFDNVTIEEICTEAKVSKGLFYNYFLSKDQILVEQFMKIDNFYKKIAEKKLKKYSGLKKLLKFISYQCQYGQFKMGKDLFRNVYRNLITTIKSGHVILDERRFLYTFLIDTIKEAQEMEELHRDMNAKDTASTIALLMRGVFYNWCLYERNFNLEKMTVKVISTYLKGLNAIL